MTDREQLDKPNVEKRHERVRALFEALARRDKEVGPPDWECMSEEDRDKMASAIDEVFPLASSVGANKKPSDYGHGFGGMLESVGPTSPAATERSHYDAVADAVNEVAEEAQKAFRLAGLEPCEWDSDNIVRDVSIGIAIDIGRMGELIRDLHARIASVGAPSATTCKEIAPFMEMLHDWEAHERRIDSGHAAMQMRELIRVVTSAPSSTSPTTATTHLTRTDIEALFVTKSDRYQDCVIIDKDDLEKLKVAALLGVSASGGNEFKPTHRHADGGLYRKVADSKYRGGAIWTDAIIYEAQDGTLYVTTPERWADRFVAIDIRQS